MNRLLYGDPEPCTRSIDMIEKHEPCVECNGVGGFYFNEDGDEITKEEYLENKGNKKYFMIPCEECDGKGYIEIYEEIPNYWEED
jgi:RecJ-like exonuclease